MIFNKKTIIISGSILFILLIALIYLIIIKKSPKPNINLNVKTATELEIEKERQAYDDYQVQQGAIYSKNIEKCAEIGKEKKVNECINDIAVQSGKKDYCEKISGDDTLKKDCLNAIDYMTISWGNDANLCNNLSDSVYVENCFQEYFVKLDSTVKCDLIKDETRKQQCANIVNKRLATVFNQPKACDLISDLKLKEDCKISISVIPKDSDKDGLSDEIELSFGTNPFKADTDGDGVNDYDEINKYHTNPRVRN